MQPVTSPPRPQRRLHPPFPALLTLLLTLLLAFAAATAQEQSAADPSTAVVPTVRIENLRSGELLVRSDTVGAYRPLARLSSEIDIEVSGPVARTSLRQRFVNDSGEWLEALYAFPLPEDAAVDRLRLHIGERVIEGEIREREEARTLYEQAREQGQRAGLVEQERPNLFTSSVANLAPGEEIVVEIGYLEMLHFDGEAFELRFPLAITPRYIPGAPSGNGGPDRVPDAEGITPPVRAPGEALGNPVTLTIDLDAGFALASIDSPSHEIVTTPSERGVGIVLAEGDAPSTRDFVLRWTPDVGATPAATLFTETLDPAAAGTPGYALLLLMPPALVDLPAPRPREMVFVIDVSGSMAGNSIVQAKAALDLALDRLGPDDRLNLIAFDDSAWALWPTPRRADSTAIEAARRFVDGLAADGGTEMRPALELALAGAPPAGVLRQVVFVTDGSVGNEAELFRLIEVQLGASRLFTVGLGAAPNSYFMRKAAEVGRGSYTFVDDLNEVARTMTALFEQLERPALTGLDIAFPEGAEVYPATVRDLYAGEPVLVHARLAALEGEVRLTGSSGGQRWQQRLDLRPSERAGVAQLWARAKIEAFEDLRFLGSDPEVIRLAVTVTALEHGLVSDYTSLVAIERTPVRPPDAELHGGELPQNLPDGQVYDAFFGGGDPFGYPATATPARLLWLLGLLLLVLASVIAPRRRSAA